MHSGFTRAFWSAWMAAFTLPSMSWPLTAIWCRPRTSSLPMRWRKSCSLLNSSLLPAPAPSASAWSPPRRPPSGSRPGQVLERAQGHRTDRERQCHRKRTNQYGQPAVIAVPPAHPPPPGFLAHQARRDHLHPSVSISNHPGDFTGGSNEFAEILLNTRQRGLPDLRGGDRRSAHGLIRADSSITGGGCRSA